MVDFFDWLDQAEQFWPGIIGVCVLLFMVWLMNEIVELGHHDE